VVWCGMVWNVHRNTTTTRGMVNIQGIKNCLSVRVTTADSGDISKEGMFQPIKWLNYVLQCSTYLGTPTISLRAKFRKTSLFPVGFGVFLTKIGKSTKSTKPIFIVVSLDSILLV
jgi:hypothetical protein